MMRKLRSHSPARPVRMESEQKDIAKYFVPASTIRAFIPTEYRF
jgi:hypothetical protein